MFLSKLFTPKWQHKNPNVRKHALLSLGNNTQDKQAIYAAVAMDDEEASIRRIAVQRLNDLDLLEQIATEDKEPGVRSDAVQRTGKILSGKLKSGPGIEVRSEKIKSITDEVILNYLLKNAVEGSIRLSIAERFNQQAIFAEVAISDSDADVQMSALRHISQFSMLERVAKQTRRKNKTLSLAAQSRVDIIRGKNEKIQHYRQEAKVLCAEVTSLINTAREQQSWQEAQIGLERVHLKWNNLIGEWRNLTDTIDEDLLQKFERACNAFDDERTDYEDGQAKRQAQSAKYIPIQQEKRNLCDKLELELNNIHKLTQISSTEMENLDALFSTNKRDWKELSLKIKTPLDQYDEALDKALNEQFQQLLDKIHAYKNDIDLYLKSIKIAKQLEVKSKRLAEKASLVKKTEIIKLQQEWETLCKPKYFRFNEIDSIDLDRQLQTLFSKYERQEQTRKHDKQHFLTVVSKLEKAVSEGKAADANHLSKQGNNLLRRLPTEDSREFRESGSLQQFQLLQKQVNELQDWRKWSSEPKKIQLCQSMEDLVSDLEEKSGDYIPNYEDIAAQVRSAREQWKNLSKAEVNASVELWEKFDQACKNAYEPCQNFFDTEAKKRDENLAQREVLCDELERYINSVLEKAHEDIDWRAVDKIVRVASKDWQKLGPVNHKDKKAIDNRFYAALNKLNKLNREQRQRNSEEKLNIIKRAEKTATDLVDERTNLNDAIAEIKKLQTLWKTIGTANKDPALWKQFRKPCDEIFALRTSKIETEKQAQQTLKQERSGICETIESFVNLDADEVIGKRAEVDALSQQWMDYEKSPKRDALEKRFTRAMEAFDKRLEKARWELNTKLKQHQQNQISVCWQIEDVVRNLYKSDIDITQAEMELSNITQAWQSMDLNQDAMSKAISDRFQTAVQLITGLSGDNAGEFHAKIEEGSKIARKTKLQLCLQLEIAADVGSPQEYRQDRMSYQVSLLANKMKHDEQTDLNSEGAVLALSWNQAGFVVENDAMELENRFFDTYNKI